MYRGCIAGTTAEPIVLIRTVGYSRCVSGTVLVDVDGTIGDQLEHALEVAARNGIDHDASPADITGWNSPVPGIDRHIGELIPHVEQEHTQEYVLDMPLLSGAREGITRLQETGWRVVICTHRSEKSHPYTARWLAANDIPFDAYAHDVPENKARLDADVLIDDYHGNIRDALNAGMTGVLFHHSYSDPDVVADHPNGKAADDWGGVVDALTNTP